MKIPESVQLAGDVYARLQELKLNEADIQLVMDPARRAAPTCAFWRGTAILIIRHVPGRYPIARIRYITTNGKQAAASYDLGPSPFI